MTTSNTQIDFVSTIERIVDGMNPELIKGLNYRCYEVTYEKPWWEYHDQIQRELEAINTLVMFRPYVRDNKFYLSFGKRTEWSEEEKVRLKGALERITASFRLHDEYEDVDFRGP